MKRYIQKGSNVMIKKLDGTNAKLLMPLKMESCNAD